MLQQTLIMAQKSCHRQFIIKQQIELKFHEESIASIVRHTQQLIYQEKF
jgi:hypothetical protein